MLKNLDPGTRSGYAMVVAALVAAGWLLAEFVPRWWMLSGLAAIGLPATMRRLDRLGLRRALTLATLIPGVGLVVAAALLTATPRVEPVARLEPRATDIGLAILGTAAIGTAFSFLSTNVLGQYGWTLFVSLPFILGLLTALIAASEDDRPTWIVLIAAGAATALTGASLLLASLEGAICLVMAAPLAIPLALLGAASALALRRAQRSPSALMSLALVVPILLVGESIGTPQPPLHRVTTEIVVAAPPSIVWRHVIAFPPLPAPRELVFRAGIAYPTGAVIDGSGIGAVRRCQFSTGDFVEPITAWNEPWRLAFDVESQPEPMTELSPHGSVHAPHLGGFLMSERGEFRLVALGRSSTLLVGSTWYRNRMWPTAYWQLWSDMIIHRIHLRVLDHVRRLAEDEVAGDSS